MGFFNFKRDNRDNREDGQRGDGRRNDRRKDDRPHDGRTPAQSFLSAFNTGAVACVALPLFVLVINTFRGGGGGGGEWFREEGSVARGFVYLWSMAVFVGLVKFANNELDSEAEGGTSWLASWTGGGGIDARKAKTLVVALAMFANLCLLCTVLVAGAGEGGAEELGRSIGEGQFIGTIFLTFVFWLIWSVGSSYSLHRIATSGDTTSGRDGDQNMGYICNPAV